MASTYIKDLTPTTSCYVSSDFVVDDSEGTRRISYNDLFKNIKAGDYVPLSVTTRNQTSSNPLVDKDFVNSSIATNTASFRGTKSNISELVGISASVNDYAFISSMISSGLNEYKRYKCTKKEYGPTLTSDWVFEYTLSNSSFTDAQWKAINSGITEDTAVRTDIAQTITAAKTFSGKLTATNGLTVSNYSGFDYSGIASVTDNTSRPVWFSQDNSANKGKPVVNGEQLSFNPNTKILKVGDSLNSTISFGDKVKLQWNSTTASLDFNFI